MATSTEGISGGTNSRRTSSLLYPSTFSKSLAERALTRRSDDGVLTIAQAFNSLFGALEPTEGERDKAKNQQQRVREKLEALLKLIDTYLSGSYRRRTLIRPLDDIDLLIVLNFLTYGQKIKLDASGAAAALDLIEDALDDAYPSTEKHRHDCCIQVQFAGTGIGFDILPVYRFTDDEFWMPDERRGLWIRTNPREVQRLVSDANQNKCGEWLVPLVKLLKAWKDKNSVNLRGFHLEALAYHALNHVPINEREGLAYLFDKLATTVCYPTPDIWPLGENADAYLSQTNRLAASAALQSAASAAASAVKAENDESISEAHSIWYSLFGDRYPETGARRAEPTQLSMREALRAISSGAFVSATSNGLAQPVAGYASVRASTDHGGMLDQAAGSAATASRLAVTVAHREWLERDIEIALRQFPGLGRLDPQSALDDPELWPMRATEAADLYAVLLGDQATNMGRRHRILVRIPIDAPAVEPRIYSLQQPVEYTPVSDGRKGVRFVPRRRYKHLWNDGSMCSHAQRDRWDGRLVSLLIFAADWLLRQDYYLLTGRWLGREIDARGRLRIDGQLTEERPLRRGRRGKWQHR